MPLAAAGLLFYGAVACAAGGDRLEDRFHAGLRDRGLFGVAEGAALRQFRDAGAAPADRQAAAVRLALALAAHGRFADGQERADLFERAGTTLDAARRALPREPAVRLDLARGRVAAVRAALAAGDAADGLNPTDEERTAASSALSIADARLGLVRSSLGDRREALARGRSRETEALSAVELADLSDLAAVELAAVRLLRAAGGDGPDARERLAAAARSLLLPVRADDLQRRRTVLLADADRLAGRPRDALDRLASVPGTLATRLRAEAAAGGAGAALRAAALERKRLLAANRVPVLGAEAEYVAAVAAARLAADARAAGRADLADDLLGRLARDADLAAAAHGGPWGRRVTKLAAVAGRSTGFSPALAAAVAAAEGEPVGSEAHAAALLAAAELALEEEGAEPGTVLSLASRAADDAGERFPDRTTDVLRAALDRFPAAPGFGPGSSAGVHLRLCGALGRAYAAGPTRGTHRAVAAALAEHRVRFADSPTAAAAAWRLARHEETRDQRTRALPVYRFLLDDPARRAAAAAGLARCHEGVLNYLAAEAARAAAPLTATARRVQRRDRFAAAAAELVPLAEAEDPAGASPATRAALAECRLRTARVLLDGAPGDRPALATAAGLLVRVRAAAAGAEPGPEAAFWAAAAPEAARRGAAVAAELGRWGEAATLADSLPDDPAALAPVLAAWAGVTAGDAAFNAARLALADRVLAAGATGPQRRAARVARAASLLATGRPTDAAEELLDVLAAGHDAAAADLAAAAVARSRSADLAAAAAGAWRRAEDAEREGTAAWLLARGRRIAGLSAAGDRPGAAKLLAVTRLLHPAADHPDARVRRTFAGLARALDPAPLAAGADRGGL